LFRDVTYFNFTKQKDFTRPKSNTIITQTKKSLPKINLIKANFLYRKTSPPLFVDFEARLEFNNVDIFSSSFNVSQLFSMFVDGDASVGVGKIVHRPILYLSEGRRASLTDGKQIIRERSSMSDMGVSTPTNFSTFIVPAMVFTLWILICRCQHSIRMTSLLFLPVSAAN
jgi:hypothetical protein